MTALLALALALSTPEPSVVPAVDAAVTNRIEAVSFGLPANAGATVASSEALASPPDSTEWEGMAVVEPRVVEEILRRWEIDPEALRLEWGVIRANWTPTAEASVELQGSGRNGYFVVRVREGDASLAIRLRAGTTHRTLVAARALARESTLTQDDMSWELRDSWGPPAGDAGVEPGWTVRRRVRPGEVLASPLVTPPDAVVSGGPVTVEWIRGSVAITLPGTALGTVPQGGTVLVRTQTGERLRGEAVAPGRVRVTASS